MPSHRITTTSLQKAISDERDANARERWDEIVHLFMTSSGAEVVAGQDDSPGTRS